MKTFWAALAFSILAISAPLPAAAKASDTPSDLTRLRQLGDDLSKASRNLHHDIYETKRVIREPLEHGTFKLKSISEEANVKVNVGEFNKKLEDYLTEYQKCFKIDAATLRAYMAQTIYNNIPTSSDYDPSLRDMPPSRRWMVMYGAKAYKQANGDTRDGNTTQEANAVLPFAIYYAQPDAVTEGASDETRVALYDTGWLSKKGDAPLGWVPKKYLREWNHNIVLRMRNPQNRQIEVPGTACGPYIPNLLFYSEPGDDNSSKGASGPFRDIAGAKSEDLKTYALSFHQYQMGTGAVAKDASYDEERARKDFAEKYGVALTLEGKAYNDKLILPIVKTGSNTSQSFEGEQSPYQVMMLGVGESTRAGVAGSTISHTKKENIQVELYILMDLTGSMEKFVGGLKTALTAQLSKIPNEYKSNFKLGFIGFRDDPTQNGVVFEGFKFHGRTDGLSENKTPFYDYTHKDNEKGTGMLSVTEFIKLLDQVKTPEKELEKVPKHIAPRELAKIRTQDGVPERLFQSLEKVVRSNQWTQDDKVLKFVVAISDAPDRLADSPTRGIPEAEKLRKMAEDAKVHLVTIRLDNEVYKGGKARYRDILSQQFEALGAKNKGSYLTIAEDGSIKEGHSYDAAFKGTIGTIIDETVQACQGKTSTEKTEDIPSVTGPDNIQEMMKQARYVFDEAMFERNKDMTIKAKGFNNKEELANTTGTEYYWVTEYDPLAVASGADAKSARVYDRYALMTKPQLEKWIEIASTVYGKLQQVEGDDEAQLFEIMASLFLSGGHSADEVNRTYGDKEKWSVLKKEAEKILPCKSRFMEEFFKFQNGQQINFDFISERESFGSGIRALRSLVDSGDILQQDVQHNQREDKNPLPDDKKIYMVPLEYLP